MTQSGGSPSSARLTPPPSGSWSSRVPVGARVGPFEVLEEVARGGGGVVLRARGPDGREVALKVLRQAGDAAAERFARERALQSELGLAEGFVPLVAAGEGPPGPWLAMPFLPGGTLRDRLRRGALPLGEAVDVVRRLAEALGRAHARGIVHRDLKPENVLFTADGVPLVADLGLAKREGAQAGLSLSVTGELRGTAGYMAPEQMRDAKTAGAPADVFALGAILYECLTGAPAFPGDSVLAVIDQVESGRVAPLPAQRPDAPRWLVRVVARCLTRDAEARFPDGAALAAALGGGAVGAPSGRRVHPGSLALGLGLGLALGAGLGQVAARRAPGPAVPSPEAPVAAVSPSAPPAAVEPAEPAEPDPPAEAETPALAPVRAAPFPGQATRPGPTLGGGAVDQDLASSKRLALVTRWGSPRLRHTARVSAVALASAADFMASADEQGILRLWLRTTGQQPRSPVTLPGPTDVLAVSPDGQHLAYVSPDGKAYALHVASGHTIGLETQDRSPTVALAWAAQGAVLMTSCADRSLNVWDLAARRPLHRSALDATVTALAASADGQTLILGTDAGTLIALDCSTPPGTWRQRSAIKSSVGPVRRVAVAADGSRAAALMGAGGLTVWDVIANTGTHYEDLLRGEARDLVFAADGTTVIGVDAETIVAFDCAARRATSHSRLPWPTRAAAVAPGEPARVALASRAGAVVWTVVGATSTEPAHGHAGAITGVVAQGRTLFTASLDGSVRRWTDPDTFAALAERDGPFRGLDLSPGGRLLAAAWGDGSRGGAVVVDLATAKPTLQSDGAAAAAVAFAAEGRGLLVAGASGVVDLVDLGGVAPTSWRGHAVGLRRLLPLPDGRLVSSGVEPAGVTAAALWPARGGHEPLGRAVVPPHGALAALPGRGARVVLGGDDGALTWWDLEAGREVRRLDGAHQGPVTAVAVSSDGALGASGGLDRTLLLWDPRDGRELERVPLLGSLDQVTYLRFDPEQGLFGGFASGVVVLLQPRD
ncbi:MAG: protein kinase [Planctomycetes bacterium]|nr:protein kinase [Planctomycetota bacterium]